MRVYLRCGSTFQRASNFGSIFWDLDLGSKFLRQDSENDPPQRACLRSALLTKEVLGPGLSQDDALSVTDPSQKAISEPFVRQVQLPIFAVKFVFVCTCARSFVFANTPSTTPPFCSTLKNHRSGRKFAAFSNRKVQLANFVASFEKIADAE